ncbi:MAG: PSD1 and planctomycete cytochrome C domain-containing protein [Pirellulaceae bacterium]|jgi:hypothetical protein|nr:PSD1 and planctomycete cytochrome C domain-containing protein [Pirellulaceae bacterium]MDP7017329.1 PSD1 and planctomycete cytochrome C domain-containing protein [Pirellulaceae bacterium]
MLVLLISALLGAEDPAVSAPSAQQLRFFENNVRPVLVEHCIGCHGDKKQWGGLRLDSRAALMKGGESGVAVAPGEPDKSLLIQAIREPDDELRMPRDGRLTKRQISALSKWVEMGAPYPRGAASSKRARDPNHWAFQPLVDRRLPKVSDQQWPLSGIDYFVLAKLDAIGLEPAPIAQRRTLIRRVTFDLIGLPPTPAEIDEFLSDSSPSAFVRVVDRLLASPRYGERWGRHWLDVARYADSNGFDENVAHGNAWRYRDYVVAAMNSDKPFDRFTTEQLAGDLLPFAGQSQQHEQLIATGFLSIGPKVLAETDQAKMRMDIIDEQLGTTGRAFLALTFGCARCHDHKFDPIDTADYYGLAGVFKSTLTMRKYTKVAEWHEHLLPSSAATRLKADFDAEVAAKKAAIAKLESEQADSQPNDDEKATLKKLRDELAAFEKAGPDLPAAMGVTEDKVVDVAVHLRGDPLKLGEVVPRRTPAVLRGPPTVEFTARQSGRRELAAWLVDPRNPLTARVMVNRIWRWHFGRGLVRSTDNFGLLGERPSHPHLLDWLARRFIADGWSIKSLHRLIVLSSTYQQANVATAEALRRDPENRLLGRSSVRRLEAEAIRDALLAASGQLDSRMGGSLLKLKNRAYFFDHTSKDLTTYASRRRSLYLPVVRNHVYEVLQVLDFPDPAVTTGSRATTVVASQALLMLNSELVMDAAEALATRLHEESIESTGSDEDERLTNLYQIAFGRHPTPDERRADRALLDEVERSQSAELNDGERRRRAWATLCHIALAANEFVYVK